MKGTIVLFGPGPQFKGGISNYNTSLAKAIDQLGYKVHIVSWIQQYPAIIPRDFIDRKSKTSFLEGTDIEVHYLTNYNNPFTWAATVSFIKKLKPEKVIVQWSIALQGLPLGWMAKRLSKLNTELIFDLHLVVQKESSSLDQLLTKYALKRVNCFVSHSYKTVEELKTLLPRSYHITEKGERSKNDPTVIKLYHPIYDLYKPDLAFDVEAAKAAMGLKKHVFLFFGFIRKYKGLHQAIVAFDALRKERDDVSLLIVGESFWKTLDQNKWSTKLKKKLFNLAKSLVLKSSDNEQDYNPLQLIETFQLQQDVKVVDGFVPNEEVHRYFQMADSILLFYLTATPSGVESLSYNFNLPVLATAVGHFPETIKDGFNGYIAEAENIESMKEVMQKSINTPIDRANVAKTAENMSWENYAKRILEF